MIQDGGRVFGMDRGKMCFGLFAVDRFDKLTKV